MKITPHPRGLADAIELAELVDPHNPTIAARIAASGHPVMHGGGDAALKDKLKKVEAELADKRGERAAAIKDRDAARDAFAGRDDITPSSPEFQAAQAAVAAVGAIEDRISELQAVQVATLKLLGEEPSGTATAQSMDAPPARMATWRSRELLASDSNRHLLDAMSSSSMRTGRVELGTVIGRDELAAAFGSPALAADVTGTTSMRRGTYGGVIPQLRRGLRVLDLLPTGTMDANTLPYTQESGNFDTAVEQVEGQVKAEAEIVFSDAEAVAATIAHWSKVRKQTLADVPALQSLMDGRLRYGVERRLENQILSGNGTGANMRGILNTPGISAVTFSAGALVSDQVLRGITTVFLADGEANAVVLHPLDWESTLNKKTSGSGEYLNSDGPFGAQSFGSMWGVPTIPSKAIAQGTALVGDFALGAQLFVREGVNVLLSDSDQNDFISNRVTILAEMRAALPVFRPAVFATVALA